MERKVTKLENSHVEVLVTVDAEAWKDAQAKGFKKVAANVTLPGFRKGKAPEAMLKGKVDPMKVMNEAIEIVLPIVHKDIMENEKIQAIMQPRVDVTKLSDTDLEVKFTFVTAPEVKIAEYKGLKIGKKEAKVTAKEVEVALAQMQQDNGSLVVKEGAAEKGDTVVIDFVGSIDGVPFDGGAAENHELELGSGQFIPGFEDQCVGLKAGDKKDINVKFPENYTQELKGKDAVFAIKCNEVKAKKVPELNDEFVKDLNIADVETVDAFKAYKKNELLENKKKQVRGEYMNALLAEIASKSQISIAQEIIDDQANARRKEIEKQMEQSGLTIDQYLSILGQKEEDFMANLKNECKTGFTNYLLILTVGEAEKIQVTDEELEAEMNKLAEQYKMKLEDVKKALEPQMRDYRNNIRMNKIEEFLFTNND